MLEVKWRATDSTTLLSARKQMTSVLLTWNLFPSIVWRISNCPIYQQDSLPLYPHNTNLRTRLLHKLVAKLIRQSKSQVLCSSIYFFHLQISKNNCEITLLVNHQEQLWNHLTVWTLMKNYTHQQAGTQTSEWLVLPYTASPALAPLSLCCWLWW